MATTRTDFKNSGRKNTGRGEGVQDSKSTSDPFKFAGKVGVGEGNVQLTHWRRENPFTDKEGARRGKRSEPGYDLRPECE